MRKNTFNEGTPQSTSQIGKLKEEYTEFKYVMKGRLTRHR